MGTRGLVGFVLDDTEKLFYNPFDSYPGGLGVDLIEWLGVNLNEDLIRKVRRFKAVEPDAKQVTQLIEAKSDLDTMLTLGFFVDASSFAADSLFCEWGYVMDLDQMVLEVYEGFQTEPHQQGRFADLPVSPDRPGTTYYPIKLIKSWRLDSLPTFDEMADLEGE